MLELLVLHTLDGRTVYLNSEQIISMAVPLPKSQNFSDGVKCVITLADGKFTSVVETCEDIREKIRRTP